MNHQENPQETDLDSMAPSPPDHTIRDFEVALPIALLRAWTATAQLFRPHTNAHGLSPQQWRVIRALAAGKPLDLGMISESCVLLHPSASRIVDNLEKRGLIVSLRASDARRRLVTLTTSGQSLFDQIATISETIYHDLEAVYGREELEQLVTMLNRLRVIAQDLPVAPVSETTEQSEGEPANAPDT